MIHDDVQTGRSDLWIRVRVGTDTVSILAGIARSERVAHYAKLVPSAGPRVFGYCFHLPGQRPVLVHRDETLLSAPGTRSRYR